MCTGHERAVHGLCHWHQRYLLLRPRHSDLIHHVGWLHLDLLLNCWLLLECSLVLFFPFLVSKTNVYLSVWNALVNKLRGIPVVRDTLHRKQLYCFECLFSSLVLNENAPSENFRDLSRFFEEKKLFNFPELGENHFYLVLIQSSVEVWNVKFSLFDHVNVYYAETLKLPVCVSQLKPWHDSNIFVYFLGARSVRVQNELGLMEELALQKCTPSVRAIILISDDPRLDHSSEFAEVGLHLFVGPALWNLTHK